MVKPLSRAKFMTKSGHGFGVAQVAMDHHALHAVLLGGNAPGRIAEVVSWAHAARTKLAHDACQPFGPVAGAKHFAVLGDALDLSLIHI